MPAPWRTLPDTTHKLTGGGVAQLTLRLRVGRGRNRRTVIAHGRHLAEVCERMWRQAARWAAREERLDKLVERKWRRAQQGGMKRSNHTYGEIVEMPRLERLRREA